MTAISIEQFEADGHENGVRFWYAHEFMKRLGYESWTGFQKVITKSMAACARLGLDPTEAFAAAAMVQDGHELRTYKLSRFACFLVAMHADPKKEEVARARAILAAIADKLIEERIEENDFGRLEARDDLKLAESQLGGAAKAAGLQSDEFGIFKDAGFRGMYNRSLQSLMAYKGVGRDKTLYDFMDLEELAGNLFRVTQTRARVTANRVRGLRELARTAEAVGADVRKLMMKDGGTAPEDLPAVEPISGVAKRIKSARRAMDKLDDSTRKKSLPAKSGA